MLLRGEQMCVMTCRGRPGHRGGGKVEGREMWISVGSTKAHALGCQVHSQRLPVEGCVLRRIGMFLCYETSTDCLGPWGHNTPSARQSSLCGPLAHTYAQTGQEPTTPQACRLSQSRPTCLPQARPMVLLFRLV